MHSYDDALGARWAGLCLRFTGRKRQARTLRHSNTPPVHYKVFPDPTEKNYDFLTDLMSSFISDCHCLYSSSNLTIAGYRHSYVFVALYLLKIRVCGRGTVSRFLVDGLI